MKLAKISLLVACLVHVSLSISQHLSDPKPIGSRSTCRVAVCISGDVRSFVDSTVHRSFQRHVVEAIRGSDCEVDVFAYASLGHQEMLEGQEAATIRKARTVLELLSPVEIVWHQEQAGIISNSCRQQNQHSGKEHTKRNSDQNSRPLSREHFGIREERFYWHLYESLAAYRMAIREERGVEHTSSEVEHPHPSTYDWIVSTRFDVTWARPLPSLRAFSPEEVWFGTKPWPMSDDFALVPRAYSDGFFSAIEAYHTCNDDDDEDDDGTSWPPGEAWWQPNCGRDVDPDIGGGNDVQNFRHSGSGGDLFSAESGNARDVDESRRREEWDARSEESRGGAEGFEGSVLYRHLHAKNVPHRPYPLFEYYSMQPKGVGGHNGSGGKSGDEGGRGSGREREISCETSTASYATACLLLGTTGFLRAGYLSEDCSAALSEWSTLRCRALMHPDATGMDDTQRLDALLNPDPGAWQEEFGDETLAEAGSKTREGQEGDGCDAAERKRVRNEDVQRAWSKLIVLRDSVDVSGDGGDEIKLRGGVDVAEDDMPGATSGGTLSEEGYQDEGGAVRHPARDDAHVWTIHSQDGCRMEEYNGKAPHVIRHYDAGPSLVREVALATKCLAHRLVQGTSGGPRASEDLEFDARKACAASRPLELVMIDVSLGSRELGICTVDSEAGLIAGDYIQGVFADPEAHCVGYGRLTLPPPPSCPELLVRELEVFHPKEGAVYWEGPVEVNLTVSLSGPGLQGLDPNSVRVCAETEKSWPIQDWTRTCVTLKELASSGEGKPALVFGSTIGVVEGSVSVRDARPGCLSPGEMRGRVLQMEGNRPAGDDDDGESRGDIGGDYPDAAASTSVRFKVIHHESLFRRRGRPIGPAPLGRGFASTQEYIQALEKEAEEEVSTVSDVMKSYDDQIRRTKVGIGAKVCLSRLDLQDRSTSLAASGPQLLFHIEQLNWMFSNGKLPKGMEYIIDRLDNGLFPNNSTEEYASRSFVLGDDWRSVGSFFQKALVIPAPAEKNVASVNPLQTWEYDEVPWMEALNPKVDWKAVEEAYLGNRPIKITHIDNFFSEEALAVLLDLARGSSIFVDNRANYLGSYPSDGMSHPLLYQIAEEAAERLPRILGRNTPGWPLVQTWFYIYGGNDGERCTRGIRVHADTAMINLNVWLAPDTANLGSAETDDGGGLTVFHAKPPDEWGFEKFNKDERSTHRFLRENGAGNTSIPHRQNRALLFDSMLFHQSDPFRFKKGFENRRLNLTLLFGRRRKQIETSEGATGGKDSGVSYTDRFPPFLREVTPWQARDLSYCL